MADQKTLFNAGMTCGGCSGAVTRILTKMEGVKSVEADVATKRVIVTHTAAVAPATMLEALKKWGAASGKAVELVGPV